MRFMRTTSLRNVRASAATRSASELGKRSSRRLSGLAAPIWATPSVSGRRRVMCALNVAGFGPPLSDPCATLRTKARCRHRIAAPPKGKR